MLALENPVEAYRRDLARNPGQDEFGATDNLWLLFLQCLRRLAEAHARLRPELGILCAHALHEYAADTVAQPPPDATSREGLELSIEGLQLLGARRGADMLARGTRRFTAQLCAAGAFSTGFTTLSFARTITANASDLQRGFLAADHGAIARELGDFDVAEDFYRTAQSLAERCGRAELFAAVAVGRGVLSHVLRCPQRARALFIRALSHATSCRSADLQRASHLGLSKALGALGEFRRALEHGWRAFVLARGNATFEADALAGLAQLCLKAGQPGSALRGFVAAIHRTRTVRVKLPQLAGAALSAALCGDTYTLEMATREFDEVVDVDVLSHEAAEASLQIASAFDAMHRQERASAYRDMARQIARTEGYFDIMYALQPSQVAQKHLECLDAMELAVESHEVVDLLSSFESDVELGEFEGAT
jgi:tetratricopeptide (TPR) repeat protein